MPIPDRLTLAQQRLRMMQQSGISKQIAATQMAHRQTAETARQTRQGVEEQERLANFQTLRNMLLLIEGAEQLRAARHGNNQPQDYQASKQLIVTLLDTSPAGKIGKQRNWGNAIASTGAAIYGAGPTTIKAAGSALANLTGVNGIQTATAVAARGTEIMDATLTAATVAPISLSPTIAATAGTNANLIQSCLSWWTSPAAAAAATYAPFLNLLTALSTGLAIYGNHQKIDAMLALNERYRDSCACGDCIAQIANAWQDDIARTAAGMSPGVGLGLVLQDSYDKVQHYTRKKLAGNGTVHRDSYYTAKKLWEAAQDKVTPGHQASTRVFTGVSTRQRCPLAMLALAALFGGGDPNAGAVKAAAAIVSEPVTAATRIKSLVAG